MTLEKVYVESNCVWRTNGYCTFEEKAKKDKLIGEFACDATCDFATLKFDKDAILERIKFEKHQIRKMFVFSRDRKKKEMLDKCVGITKLYDALEKHFGMPNPLKEDLEKYMTDFDRIKSFIKGVI
jgi:hypothetical protein